MGGGEGGRARDPGSLLRAHGGGCIKMAGRCVAASNPPPPHGLPTSMRMAGLMSSSTPIEVRLRSPPLMPLRKKPPGQRGASVCTRVSACACVWLRGWPSPSPPAADSTDDGLAAGLQPQRREDEIHPPQLVGAGHGARQAQQRGVRQRLAHGQAGWVGRAGVWGGRGVGGSGGEERRDAAAMGRTPLPSPNPAACSVDALPAAAAPHLSYSTSSCMAAGGERGGKEGVHAASRIPHPAAEARPSLPCRLPKLRPSALPHTPTPTPTRSPAARSPLGALGAW